MLDLPEEWCCSFWVWLRPHIFHSQSIRYIFDFNPYHLWMCSNYSFPCTNLLGDFAQSYVSDQVRFLSDETCHLCHLLVLPIYPIHLWFESLSAPRLESIGSNFSLKVYYKSCVLQFSWFRIYHIYLSFLSDAISIAEGNYEALHCIAWYFFGPMQKMFWRNISSKCSSHLRKFLQSHPCKWKHFEWALCQNVQEFLQSQVEGKTCTRLPAGTIF